MEKDNVFILTVFGIVAVALICYLVWKNKKDKKLLNPDAPDSVEETHMDQERRADKI